MGSLSHPHQPSERRSERSPFNSYLHLFPWRVGGGPFKPGFGLSGRVAGLA